MNDPIDTFDRFIKSSRGSYIFDDHKLQVVGVIFENVAKICSLTLTANCSTDFKASLDYLMVRLPKKARRIVTYEAPSESRLLQSQIHLK